jgi:hypothetical protein
MVGVSISRYLKDGKCASPLALSVGFKDAMIAIEREILQRRLSWSGQGWWLVVARYCSVERFRARVLQRAKLPAK